jgi:hypothetical protein
VTDNIAYLHHNLTPEVLASIQGQSEDTLQSDIDKKKHRNSGVGMLDLQTSLEELVESEMPEEMYSFTGKVDQHLE